MDDPGKDPGMESFPGSLLLVGAGKMGSAMLRGWLDLGFDACRLSVIEPQPSPDLFELAARTGLRLTAPERPPEVLVLAVKPQMLDAAAADLASLVSGETLVVSILAGKTIANIVNRLPRARAVIRAMPNLPAAIGRGITGAAANPAVTSVQRQIADTLLSGVGQVEWLPDESLIDAVTAVSGSGPAYVFYLVECLAQAAIAAGLPPEMADRFARATVEGAAELMHHATETSPAQLRENVTSPGGTTAAALEVLMAQDGLASLMQKAVAAAKRRADELSG
jgi:pyrroline-5-carboxylate reductase